jgi:hypothetical protein
MALTYTWKLKSLKKTDADGLSGVIVGTQWELTGTDEDGIAGTFHGATPFKLAEVDTENFTPYEELTQAQILSWIDGIVVGSYKEHIDGQIQKQIDAQKNPVVEVNDGTFPWDEPAESAPAAEPTPAPVADETPEA